jgi:hypothetical protein
MWISAANNLSVGLFWEYSRARFLKTAKYDKDLSTVFKVVDESVTLIARSSPNMSPLELERLTLAAFQRFVAVNVESIVLANGVYSMKIVNNRGKTNDWVATPVKDKDIPSIVASLPPAVLSGAGFGIDPLFSASFF